MNDMTLLVCPKCKREMKLAADMVANKNIKCCGCGERMPYSEYINPEALLQKQKRIEEEAYMAEAAEALQKEMKRKAEAAHRHQEELAALALAEAERKRKEEEEAAARARAEAERKRKEEEEAAARARAEAERKRKEEEEAAARARAEAERKRKEEEEAAARARAEAERKRKEEEAKAKAKAEAERKLAWQKEGKYASIGSLQLKNGVLRPLKSGQNTVGRGVDASISIEKDNIKFSRVHLEIMVTGSDTQGYAHEAKLAKKEVNRTCLNGSDMAYGQTYRLRNGDVISLPTGNLEFKFVAF